MTYHWRQGPHTVPGRDDKGRQVEVRTGITDRDGVTVKVGQELVVLDPRVAIEFADSVRRFAAVRLGWRP